MALNLSSTGQTNGLASAIRAGAVGGATTTGAAGTTAEAGVGFIGTAGTTGAAGTTATGFVTTGGGAAWMVTGGEAFVTGTSARLTLRTFHHCRKNQPASTSATTT